MLQSKHIWAMRKLLFLVKPYWPKLALALVCMIGVSAFTAFTAYLIKPAMDDIFMKQNVQMLKLMPLLILIVFFFKGLFEWGNDNLLQSVGLSIVTSLRQKP